MRFKRRRKGDPVVTSADGDRPAKATRQREKNVSIVGIYLHVEGWECKIVVEERAMLFTSYSTIL
jgi:hypothetical protein